MHQTNRQHFNDDAAEQPMRSINQFEEQFQTNNFENTRYVQSQAAIPVHYRSHQNQPDYSKRIKLSYPYQSHTHQFETAVEPSSQNIRKHHQFETAVEPSSQNI